MLINQDMAYNIEQNTDIFISGSVETLPPFYVVDENNNQVYWGVTYEECQNWINNL
jgi:hypothetical protein